MTHRLAWGAGRGEISHLEKPPHTHLLLDTRCTEGRRSHTPPLACCTVRPFHAILRGTHPVRTHRCTVSRGGLVWPSHTSCTRRHLPLLHIHCLRGDPTHPSPLTPCQGAALTPHGRFPLDLHLTCTCAVPQGDELCRGGSLPPSPLAHTCVLFGGAPFPTSVPPPRAASTAPCTPRSRCTEGDPCQPSGGLQAIPRGSLCLSHTCKTLCPLTYMLHQKDIHPVPSYTLY